MSYLDEYLGYGEPANGKILYIGFKEGGGFHMTNPITPNPCSYTYCGINPCGHNSCRIKVWEHFRISFVDISEQENLENSISPFNHILTHGAVRTWTGLNIISMSEEGLITTTADRSTIITIPATPNNYSPYYPIVGLTKQEAYLKYKMFQKHSTACIAHITLPFLPTTIRTARIGLIMPHLCETINKYKWKAIVIYARNKTLRDLLLHHCSLDINTLKPITRIPSIYEGTHSGIPVYNFPNVGGVGQPSYNDFFKLGRLL